MERTRVKPRPLGAGASKEGNRPPPTDPGSRSGSGSRSGWRWGRACRRELLPLRGETFRRQLLRGRRRRVRHGVALAALHRPELHLPVTPEAALVGDAWGELDLRDGPRPVTVLAVGLPRQVSLVIDGDGSEQPGDANHLVRCRRERGQGGLAQRLGAAGDRQRRREDVAIDRPAGGGQRHVPDVLRG